MTRSSAISAILRANMASGMPRMKRRRKTLDSLRTHSIKAVMDQGLHEYIETFISQNNILGQEISDGYRFYS